MAVAGGSLVGALSSRLPPQPVVTGGSLAAPPPMALHATRGFAPYQAVTLPLQQPRPQQLVPHPAGQLTACSPTAGRAPYVAPQPPGPTAPVAATTSPPPKARGRRRSGSSSSGSDSSEGSGRSSSPEAVGAAAASAPRTLPAAGCGTVPSQGVATMQVPCLTQGLPTPDSIAQQKEAYARDLEGQLREGVQLLGQTHKQKTDLLHRTANENKQKYNLMLDAEVKKKEMLIQQQFNHQLLVLQQAAQQQRAELEQQAAGLTLDWEHRQTQDEFLKEQAAVQQRYAQAAQEMEKEMEKFGSQGGSLLPMPAGSGRVLAARTPNGGSSAVPVGSMSSIRHTSGSAASVGSVPIGPAMATYEAPRLLSSAPSLALSQASVGGSCQVLPGGPCSRGTSSVSARSSSHAPVACGAVRLVGGSAAYAPATAAGSMALSIGGASMIGGLGTGGGASGTGACPVAVYQPPQPASVAVPRPSAVSTTAASRSAAATQLPIGDAAAYAQAVAQQALAQQAVLQARAQGATTQTMLVEPVASSPAR